MLRTFLCKGVRCAVVGGIHWAGEHSWVVHIGEERYHLMGHDTLQVWANSTP